MNDILLQLNAIIDLAELGSKFPDYAVSICTGIRVQADALIDMIDKLDDKVTA